MFRCDQDGCDNCRTSDATCGKVRELRDDWEHYVSEFTD